MYESVTVCYPALNGTVNAASKTILTTMFYQMKGYIPERVWKTKEGKDGKNVWYGMCDGRDMWWLEKKRKKKKKI
jgi:hypothetical protein